MTEDKNIPLDKTCREHSGLVANIDAIKHILEEHGLLIQRLFGKLDLIGEKLVKRPSWAVTLYITLCTSIAGVLVTVVICLISMMTE